MNYRDELFARMDRTLSEMMEVARSYQEIARESEEFLDRYQERRKDRNRPDRCPAYPTKKQQARALGMNYRDLQTDFDPTVVSPEDDTAVVFDCTATIHSDEDQTPCPGTELMRGQYEGRLIRKLEQLRGNLRYLDDRRRHAGNRFAQTLVLARIRSTLDLIRLVQTYLNKTGSWSFLLVEKS